MTSAFSRRDLIRQAKELALASPFLSLVSCGREGAGRKATAIGGATMGTTYSVKIAGDLPAGADRRDLAAGIARILETVNRQMSTYRADSELSRFNAAAPDAWIAVSPDTFAVVEEALRVGRLSRGAFDPTVAPLVTLWGFGPDGGPRRVPSRQRIARALAKAGHGRLRTRGALPALAKTARDVRVDLCGVAKGFGVDKVAEYLERAGIEDYLVEIGGELRGRGASPRGEPWRIGIEKPAAVARGIQRVVRLDGRAMATSGDYRIFFERDGARFSHLIDPRSGRPVDHGLASATVVAASTMAADALSTALMVLGPEAGPRLARQENIAAYFITRRGGGFAGTASPAMNRYLTA